MRVEYDQFLGVESKVEEGRVGQGGVGPSWGEESVRSGIAGYRLGQKGGVGTGTGNPPLQFEWEKPVNSEFGAPPKVS